MNGANVEGQAADEWPGAGATNAAMRVPAAMPRVGSGSFLLDLLLIALLVLLLRIPECSVSVINWDEAAYALMARELLSGHLPYTTYWEMKPIGSAVVIAAAMGVFGQSIEVVRAVGAACVALTGWLLYFIVRRVSPGRFTPLVAAFLYAAFSTRLDGTATMTEVLLAPLTTAGILLLISAPGMASVPRQGMAIAAAGLLLGLAVWIKYVPGTPAALVGGFCLLVILNRSGGRMARVLRYGIAFAFALVLPTLLTALWFWWAGALGDFLQANFGFAGAYLHAGKWKRKAVDLGLVVVEIWPLLLLSAAVFLPGVRQALFRPERRFALGAIGLWLAGELGAAVLPMQFWPHYFLMMLPPLCVLSALAIEACIGRLTRHERVARTVLAAAACVCLIPGMRHAFDAARLVMREDVPRRIAEIVAREGQPDPSVYVVNYEPVIYFLAGAPLPTRYAFPSHLISSYGVVARVDPWAEIGRILDNRPKFIVLNDSWSDGLRTTADPGLKDLILDTIARRYGLRATLPTPTGTVKLFVLRGDG